jgi:hypothetical protein
MQESIAQTVGQFAGISSAEKPQTPKLKVGQHAGMKGQHK